MENRNDNKEDLDRNAYEMAWKDIKSFQHRYIMNFPKNLQNESQMFAEIPYPMFDPHIVTNFDEHKDLFKSNIKKTDSRLEYYKKLYAKDKKNINLKNIKVDKLALLPRYIIDVANGTFDDQNDKSWFYLGGVLDYFLINDVLYISRVNENYMILVTQLDNPNNTTTIPLDKTPIYNLKCGAFNGDIVLAARQKHQISLFHLYLKNDKLKIKLIWQLQTPYNHSFMCTSLNEFRSSTIGVIDNAHKFKSIDYTNNKILYEYNFKPDFNILNDNFSQIDYLDRNCIIYMNRKDLYLLDLRSQTFKKTELKKMLECDDLCTFSRNKSWNSLTISSIHNAINFDLLTFKSNCQISHMMSTPPFISTIVSNLHQEYVCVLGSHLNDITFFNNSINSLSTPQYIPNITDSIRETKLTKEWNVSEYSTNRLTLPILGLKLYEDDITDDLFIFTSNSIGDVFQQKLLPNKPPMSECSNKLITWTDKLTWEPKQIEITSICNLKPIVDAACARIPSEKNLRALMKEDDALLNLFEKDCGDITKGHLAEVMNSIWIEKSFVIQEIDEDTNTFKVSNWLNSVI